MKIVGIVVLAIIASAASAKANPAKWSGKYWCQVEDSGTVYTPQKCSIKKTPAGAYLLEKAGGSQRFSGVVMELSDKLRFAGLFFCPQGACDEMVNGDLVPIDGGYRIALRDSYIVTMTRSRPTRPATP